MSYPSTLSAESDAGLVQTRTVTLNAGERLSGFDLIVQPGWSARGAITGLRQNDRVVIGVEDSDSHVLVRKRFQNGSYAIHGLPPEVRIVARATSGHSFVRAFSEGNASEAPIDFHLSGKSKLSGRLTSGGRALRGMLLRIVPEDSRGLTANVATTESGRYAARRLSNGRCEIHTVAGHRYVVGFVGDTTFDIEVPQNLSIAP